MLSIRWLFLVFILFSGSVMAQTDSCPCCSEVHSAFDFWLGEWEVFNSEGAQVGTNKIVKEQNGCIISEN